MKRFVPPTRPVVAVVTFLVAILAATFVVATVSDPEGRTAHGGPEGRAASPCAAASPGSGSSGPVAATTAATTIDLVEQTYFCIVEHYVTGPTLDHQRLLTSAFGGLTRELDQHGLDRADATPPALTGDRDSDWSAFRAVYENVVGHLPHDAALRRELAASTVTGMVDSLHDNHAAWVRAAAPAGGRPGDLYGLGFTSSPSAQFALAAPEQAQPPLFVTRVLGGPAAEHDLRPGDVVVTVDGVAPFVDGVPTDGVMRLLSQQAPRSEAVELTLRRPSTGRTWTVALTPKWFEPTAGANAVAATGLLDGAVATIQLTSFAPGAADQVLAAVAGLRQQRVLRGLVLDLRGNGGGSPAEVARLLGAFAPGRTWSHDCDATGTCTANRIDDTVAPMNLPLVVLVDRDCASACDAFSGAVRDLGVGRLVGTRTAGLVSGPNSAYVLADGSVLLLPSHRQTGANGEVVDGVGVASDVYVRLTAEDLSNGRDPAVGEALRLLGR